MQKPKQVKQRTLVISHKEMENHRPGDQALEAPARLQVVMERMYQLKNDLASRGGRSANQIDIHDPTTSPEMETALNAVLNGNFAVEHVSSAARSPHICAAAVS